MKTLRVVTTSWDDGHPSDLRVAELLRSRGIRGTFYIPLIGRHEGPILSHAQLRLLLAQGFEIGAHGITHQALPQFRPADLVREVATSKSGLEDILGEEIKMFCYPKGRYSENVIRQVKLAGYMGARTTRWLGNSLDFDPFKMPTSLHAYPHGTWDYIRNAARGENVSGLFDYLTDFRRFTTWVDLAKRLFDGVLKNGGVWHLYGHSWAIDKLDLWNDLAQILDYVGMRENVTYASNSGLLNLSTSSNGSSPARLGALLT